jgi:lipopolysaccharide assembly protein A
MLPLIFGFILGVATIIFALQNPAAVSLNFLQWGFESSLAAVILLTAGIGLILGILFSLPSIIRRSLTIRSLRKENQSLRADTETLQQWNEQTVAHYENHAAVTAPQDTRPI